MKHFLLLISLLLAISAEGYAFEVRDSASIHFRQGKSKIEPSLYGNSQVLDSIIGVYRTDSANSTTKRLKKIIFVGAASPEGSAAINKRLSQKRADNLFNYLSDRVDLPDSLTGFEWEGRDWNGLYAMVQADKNVPDRDEVLQLIEEITEDIAAHGDNASNLAKIQSLKGGVPYAYMYSRMFPALRASKIYTYYDMPSLLSRINGYAYFTPEKVAFDGFTPVVFVKKERKPFYMSLSTNMLYDALALPNIGAEFYLGKNWSIAGNWMYGWWDSDPQHRYWRAYGGYLAVRKWFGKAANEKPLTGNHIGLYAGVVTYDFEFGGTGYMGGLPGKTLWDRCNTMFGVEYGYSLPISKHLNIDFTIGVGYLGGKYIKYVPDHDFYVWKETKHLNWFGPTKLEISLVWLLGHDNYNHRK
ncbi:MAG: DUF3575 domain-containing protein [Paramuribaculum sp.]|nr:DUF3575 domain-containing protein [Paramuribaculum sp.]